MPTLTLARANKIVAAALARAREMKVKPLAVALLDASGHVTGQVGAGSERRVRSRPPYSSGSVLNSSGCPAPRPSSVASAAFDSATSRVYAATTQAPRWCAVIMTR